MPKLLDLRTVTVSAVALAAVSIPLFAQAGSPQEPTTLQPKPAAAPQESLETTLNAMIGKPAPTFTLPDQNDKPIQLADSKGKWVVLAFYPADMTRGCTFQNISYSNNVDKFAPLNAVVYTVSTQGTASKREFCSKEGLKNTLLSDEGGKVAAAYGVYNGKVARRVTFYIAPDGTVAGIETKPNVQKAAEQSLEMLTQLSGKKLAATVDGTPAIVDTQADGTGSRLVGPAATKVALGAMIADFGLPDAVSGKTLAMTTLSAGKKATVIVFLSTECPVSNAYNERMAQIAAAYKAKGVQFIGINANDGEATSAIATHARQNDFSFPVLKDANQAITDRFDAKVTPEVFVADAKGICVYHGPIDNNQNAGSVTKKYLTNALDDVLAGKAVAVKSARAFGCGIKRAQK
jgi:peroxiredoxin